MWLLFAFLVYAEIWHCTRLAMAIIYHRAAAVRWSSMWSVFIVPLFPLLTEFVNLTKVSDASVSTFLMFVCGDDGGDGDAKAMHCNVV